MPSPVFGEKNIHTRSARNMTTRMGKEGEEEAIETWAVKKGELSSGFTKIPSAVYDQFFSNRFRFQNKSYLDSEW